MQLTIALHRKWWVIPSMSVLSLFFRITGRTPELEQITSWYAANGFELIVDGKRTRLGAL